MKDYSVLDGIKYNQDCEIQTAFDKGYKQGYDEAIQKALAKKQRSKKIESIIEALKQELCDNCIREQTVFYYCPRCGYVCHRYPEINECEYCGAKFEVDLRPSACLDELEIKCGGD